MNVLIRLLAMLMGMVRGLNHDGDKADMGHGSRRAPPSWILRRSRTAAASPRSTATSRQFLVIEMDMHGGNLNLMMIVMRACQPFRQLARMMVENIGQGGDAISRHIAVETQSA